MNQEREAGAVDAEGYAALDRLARRTVADFVGHLREAREEGIQIVAYGAGSKACTLLGVTDVGPDLLPMVADLSSAKHGRGSQASGCRSSHRKNWSRRSPTR